MFITMQYSFVLYRSLKGEVSNGKTGVFVCSNREKTLSCDSMEQD